MERQGQRGNAPVVHRSLTSRLRDRGVGGLHRHRCAIAHGGSGEIGEAGLSSHGVAAGTAAVAERVLDHSLAEA